MTSPRSASSWTAEEDQLIRALYPDYDRLQRQLKLRTRSALKHRARRIGVTVVRHVWTNIEVASLRALFAQGIADRDLVGKFPHLQLGQIRAKAQHLGLTRPRRAPVLLGVPLLDGIRQRAALAGLSLVELDRRASTGRYFQSCRRNLDLRCIWRAAQILSGEIRVNWQDPDD
ncbi:SANT/Myb-like DNA-binding domain-containing protein [Novosphingobium sp. CECT 9465]|uniref:SANT/Myb-like DNA-binding domain-containing protein n=1 Tax=Novosphingobium sp. CECT 9465 TaxID=2829794 RepID=UPI001E46C5CE|nr:SANT/Myb-like DNA-binding domain-containing protein [Novosphingobium sp. CECT 9465]CAH0496458.1 hypothetical protein NVSP9465_01492 [Novosphingobium sp. CECT 9465]